MTRFLTIVNNKIVAERHAKEIVSSEVWEDNQTINAKVGDVLIDGVWQQDPLEIAEIAKRNRITELKELISNKLLLGDDVTEDRNELRTLLGM